MSESLGDILQGALDPNWNTRYNTNTNTETKNMTKIDLNLTVHMNSKKINAIKAVRDFTGLGLTEAKAYVENYDEQARRVRLTAEQFGKLALYAIEGNLVSWNEAPQFSYSQVKRVTETSVISDFTANV
jgi:hypothetical protein